MNKIKKIEKKEGSVLEITIEVPFADIEKHRTKALKTIGEHVKIDGFRAGHIPEKVLVERVGEIGILEECANEAISDIYPEIILNEKIKPLTNPKILITKIAENSPLEAVITVPVIPEIKLPDYKKIASGKKKNPTPDATEDEVEKVINEIKEYRKKAENKDDIDDDFVKTLGEFKSVSEFKEKVKENLKTEKEFKEKENHRLSIIEGVREKSEVDLPEVMVEGELHRMMGEFDERLKRMGKNLNDFKKESGKTDEDIKKEWRERAIDRVKNEIILFEIAKKEELKPKPEDIEHEAKHMIEHYPGVDESRIKSFVEEMLTKEEVFKFLETQEKK